MKIFFLFAVSTALVFCSSATYKKEDSVPPSQVSKNSSDKITYLFFTIQKNNGNETVKFESQKTADGKLKSFPEFAERNLKTGDLLITIFNNKNQPAYQQIVKNPLNPVVESYDGEMKQNQLSFDKADFHIRFPYSQSINKVTVEILKNSKKIILLNQKL